MFTTNAKAVKQKIMKENTLFQEELEQSKT